MEPGPGKFSFGVMATAVLLLVAGPAVFAQSTQERVHRMSHTVMPFEMSKTIHVFKMTETGGILRVLVRDPDDTGQVALIRGHLAHEAAKFQRGDYGDPGKLHGPDMPGLRELEANASRIRTSCHEIPGGAEIRFETEDIHLITAIHRWFGAQLSEHGTDARAG